jgi:hypothetical protein
MELAELEGSARARYRGNESWLVARVDRKIKAQYRQNRSKAVRIRMLDS